MLRTGSDASSISSLTSNTSSDTLDEQSDDVSVLSGRMRANMQSLNEMNDVGFIVLDGRTHTRRRYNFHSSPLPISTRSPSFLLVANDSSQTANRGTGMQATYRRNDSPSRIHESQIEIEVREYQRLHVLLWKRRPPSRNAPVDGVQFHASNTEGDVKAGADELSDIS